jgi:hypothetical protein
VAFFESADTPAARFDRERAPLPWEEGLGQTVVTDVILAKGSDGLLMLRNLVAFPKVMTLSVVALFRNPLAQGTSTRGQNSPTFGHSFRDKPFGAGIVLTGLRFGDGSCYRNLDERGSPGHLGGLHGLHGISSFLGIPAVAWRSGTLGGLARSPDTGDPHRAGWHFDTGVRGRTSTTLGETVGCLPFPGSECTGVIGFLRCG